MSNLMKKRIAAVLACALLLLFLAGCNAEYQEEQFIGKTSTEIEKEYGRFDCVLMPVSADGLYRNCKCGYTIAEPQVGFWGTAPEVLLFILFDESGTAISCEKGHRPGG